MKKLFLFACLLGINGYAGECGCKTEIVNVHEHEGTTCEANEVMVGHDMEKGVVMCGTVECHCGCPIKKETKL